LTPNTTYYILVSLASTTAGALATGDYDLTFTLHPTPANDLPCNATLVTGTLNDIVNGPAATPDVDVACNYNIPAQTSTGYGVWYRFTPATSKLLYAKQTGSDVLVYGLFTGPDCSSLSEITCRMGDNAELTTNNYAAFELQGGTQYWLLVGKIANSQPFGFYNLQIELREPSGACCIGTTCSITTDADCTGTWRGAFTTCGSVPNYEDVAAAAIPDSTSGTSGTPGMLTRTINIADAGTINDLKVLVDINHARVGDLIMTIQAPGGAIQDLIRRIDDDTNLTNCPTQGQQGRLADLGDVYIFDDQGAFNPYGPTLADAAGYFDFTGLLVLGGHYQPTTCNEQIVSLNAVFVGQSITGTWTLTITDNQSGSTGTLNRWGLIINGGQTPPCLCRADFNNSGAVTVQDIFDFLGAYFSALPSADINGVGGVTVQDIFDFLALYFQGC
jgi:subtilisin-like proprotein convertase family protein